MSGHLVDWRLGGGEQHPPPPYLLNVDNDAPRRVRFSGSMAQTGDSAPSSPVWVVDARLAEQLVTSRGAAALGK
ncbi:MAG: hypothetical protein QOI54_1835 [Actinomycetota bacterium]|jgi:hypothetical protein|nr:hypothetical protein [Actinomycetota bacterium]